MATSKQNETKPGQTFCLADEGIRVVGMTEERAMEIATESEAKRDQERTARRDAEHRIIDLCREGLDIDSIVARTGYGRKTVWSARARARSKGVTLG